MRLVLINLTYYIMEFFRLLRVKLVHLAIAVGMQQVLLCRVSQGSGLPLATIL